MDKFHVLTNFVSQDSSNLFSEGLVVNVNAEVDRRFKEMRKVVVVQDQAVRACHQRHERRKRLKKLE